jgi:ankyrin repeat protein
MASHVKSVKIDLPTLPAKHDEFIPYLQSQHGRPVREVLEPFKAYDAELRKIFAQQPEHPAAQQPNILPLFAGHEQDVKVRARDLAAESVQEKEFYIMPLKDEQRRADGSPAIVSTIGDFRKNFNVFSESALVDLDWSNVVVAGSAVVTPLLAVPAQHAESKRTLREYYHEKLAPASDVDLFLYGLTEEQAKEKIVQIEQNIRDAILTETTTIRTKNAITIASQYPTRHIQIVLRIYNSVSEILTGFDVDCSCAAYDGKQVYASPRAIAAYITQTNVIDLSRRSPSYENRLSKYAHRGFEIYWPHLDRTKVDPTIFERSFGRTEGLARLLVLEKLPKSDDRDAYMDQRRAERGRPIIQRWLVNRHKMRGNIKDQWQDEVAEWVDQEEVSNYHTFTVPYGPKFHAKKIEKLLYTKDILLNAEWNTPKNRDVHLHRHPAFFGRAIDVFGDCCGTCPKPSTVEEDEVAEEENKIYINGDIQFIRDDPGRQTIGSFNPLSAEDWTDMAYVGNTARLCQAIVDGDADYVRTWLEQDGNEPNTRDYTGRTPLHLAVAESTPEVVQILIDHGARLIARLVDGRTALHLAALRGNVEMVKALLQKSEANEEINEEKISARRAARKAANPNDPADVEMSEDDVKISQDDPEIDDDGEDGEDVEDGEDGEDGGDDEVEEDDKEDADIDMIEEDEADEDDDMDATTEHSMIKIKQVTPDADDRALQSDEDNDEPDVYDINILAWDSAASPLHLAIVNGHVDVVKCLIQEFGADVLLPIKLVNEYDKSPRAAILTLVLALQLPFAKAEEMTRALLQSGATTAQADLTGNTVLSYAVAEQPAMIDVLLDADKAGVDRAINAFASPHDRWTFSFQNAFLHAIEAKDSLTALKLLSCGAKPSVDIVECMKYYESKEDLDSWQRNKPRSDFERQIDQPIICAVHKELPSLVRILLEYHEIDVNTLSREGFAAVAAGQNNRDRGETLLDVVRAKIKGLKEWKHEPEKIDAPFALEKDEQYLSGHKAGSYAHWLVRQQISDGKKEYERAKETFDERNANINDQTGVKEKQSAIASMLQEFEDIESLLKAKGAKTFAELYPDIPLGSNDIWVPGYHHWKPEAPKPFKICFKFGSTSIEQEWNETAERFLRLFEASWDGDIHLVKELTLSTWKNSDGEEQPPLKIATGDQSNFTPFSLAVLRGHLQLATVIMEIAQAQYVPEDAPVKKHYRLDGGVREYWSEDSDGSEVGGDDEIRLYSELVDQQFTVETIGQVSTQVKSKVKPLTLLEKAFPAHKFIDTPPSPAASTPEPCKESWSLIQYALHKEDVTLLRYLLQLGEQYLRIESQNDEDGPKTFYTISDNDYSNAILVDKPQIMAEIITRTGAGLSFERLAKDSGVKPKDKPKSYLGLSVYGKKRKAWAEAGRRSMRQDIIDDPTPPLLHACHVSALANIEWFSSDAPIRCYQEFAAKHEEDKRIKLLAEAPGGFTATVQRFLDARSHLALHCCVLGLKEGPHSARVLRYLIKVMPDNIDTKSSNGRTALSIAFQLKHFELAKILIEAGADQTCRDVEGRNLLYHVLALNMKKEEWEIVLPKVFELLDARLLPTLFAERTSAGCGTHTPLSLWTTKFAEAKEFNSARSWVLKYLLKYPEASTTLNFVDGAGHTPLHNAAQKSDWDIARIILGHNPGLLLREDSTGRTPLEIVEDQEIGNIVGNPVPLGSDWNRRNRTARARGLPSDWGSSLVKQSPKSFVPAEEGGDPESGENDRLKTLRLLRETFAELQRQGQAKRKLVTLNEANEVARRLAATKAGSKPAQAVNDPNEDDVDEDNKKSPVPKDEVELWLC